MKSKGQEIAEFAIITLVVAVVVIGSLFIFSDNIRVFFENNPAIEKARQPVPTFDLMEPVSSADVYTPPPGLTDIEIVENTDGSIQFKYQGQDVVISNDLLANLDEVFMTSGASGVNNDVVEAIAYLINEHKAEYEPHEVPIKMGFGKGTRAQGESYKPNELQGQTYQGFAEANTVSIAVGNHLMVVQKDQGSIVEHETGATCTENTCGSHTVEFIGNSGTIVKSQFPPLQGKKLEGVTFDDGLPQGNFGLPGQVGVIDDSSWKFDFSETVQKYVTGT